MPDLQQRTLQQAAIKAVIVATTGIDADNVFDGHFRTHQPQDYRDAFLNTAGHIEAWFVSRVSTGSMTSETDPGKVAIGSEIIRRHRWKIDAYLGIETGQTAGTPGVTGHTSETAFQDVVDDFLSAFNEKASLGETAWNADPPQARVVEFAYLGDVFCHHAEFEMDTYEWIGGLVRR